VTMRLSGTVTEVWRFKNVTVPIRLRQAIHLPEYTNSLLLYTLVSHSLTDLGILSSVELLKFVIMLCGVSLHRLMMLCP